MNPALYQLMPALTPDELGALREDIMTRGVIVAIVVDEHGTIIDGHHRARIAASLDVPCPRDVRAGLSDDEKADLAVALNFNRRSLTREQKTRIIVELRSAGWTQQRIADAIGVSHQTVGRQLRNVHVDITPETITASDGRERPATYKPRTPAEPKVVEVVEPVEPVEACSTDNPHACTVNFIRDLASNFTVQDAATLTPHLRNAMRAPLRALLQTLDAATAADKREGTS